MRKILVACIVIACASAVSLEAARLLQAQAGAPNAGPPTRRPHFTNADIPARRVGDPVAAAALGWKGRTATPQAQSPAPQGQFSSALSPVRDLVSTYCITCHNERLKTAGLMLDKADPAQVGTSAETWEKVVVKLRARAMPPPGSRRPPNDTYDVAASWLETELERAAAANLNPGRPGIHRLNRAEYVNAIRDLLGVEIDGRSWLPPDGQAYGFDNIADALTVTPGLLDRYLTAAAKISRMATGDPSIPPGFERYTVLKHDANEKTWLWQDARLSEEFPLGSRGGVAARHYFPVDGEYVLKARLDRTYTGFVRGLNVPNQVDFRVDGKRVGLLDVKPEAPRGRGAAPADDEYSGGDYARRADDRLEVRVPLKAGTHEVVVTLVSATSAMSEGLGPARMPIWSHTYDGDRNAPMGLGSLLIGGPYNGRVPQDTISRRRIFVCYPTRARDETACATKILSTLARRAYRRPVTREDVQTLLGFYKAGRAEGDFEAGIRSALERMLVDPDFLFRIERDPANVAPGAAYRLSDLELVSRLSFFLWSSIPDDELLEVAERGRLKDPAVLKQQVQRMLADPRTRQSLVDTFFSQWLQVRNVLALTPDTSKQFPWFDDNLRMAFVKETELFLHNQLEEDRPVTDLLTADYTFLNERVARHYGVPNVYGSHFRRVALTNENRRGILGHGSILSVTSYPHRTSPTVRGKWLLENILAAPMPPPPPNVDTTLKAEGGKPQTVREMLEQHRKNPGCGTCHSRMDPLGLSLENYDAMGQWRTSDAGQPINASGVLLDGTKFQGPAELRNALVERQEQFVRAATGKLLTFALGRPVEYYDAPVIRQIARAAAANDYRWSSVIMGIIESTPFQMRRSKS